MEFLFLLAMNCSSYGLILKYGLYTGETPLEKTNVSCASGGQLEIASG